MYEHIIQAARQSAREAIQAFVFDEPELSAIAPYLAATAIYDATEHHLANSAAHDLAANDFTKDTYTQLEALFVKEFVSTYMRLSPQV